MVASAAEHGEDASLERTCHVCKDVVESDVWYARTQSADEEGPCRVYTCPQCYFDLSDAERDTYYRERV
jgi:DNA-directed RNA polymerase subunit M/transcription elongation factor TFIIS